MTKEGEPFIEADDHYEGVKKKEEADRVLKKRKKEEDERKKLKEHTKKLTRGVTEDVKDNPPLSDEAFARAIKMLKEDPEEELVKFEFRPGDTVPSPVKGDKNEWKVDRIEKDTGKIWLVKKDSREPLSELVENSTTYIEITAEELTDLIFEKDLDRVDEFLDRGEKDQK